MNRTKYFCTIICLLLLSLSSCIKEDVTGCAQSVSFTFRDSGNDPHWPIGNGDLQSLTVYVFDENDNYIKSIQFTNPGLDTPYTKDASDNPIALDPGAYSFVVWSNVMPTAYNVDVKQTPPCPRIEDYLSVATQGSRSAGVGIVSQTANLPLARLFYSEKDTIVGNGSNNVVFDLFENSNLLNIKVVGLPFSAENSMYTFIVEDSNGKYNFNNDFGDVLHDVAYQTVSTYTAAADTLSAQLTVLKLAQGRQNPPQLVIYEGPNTVTQIFNANLLDLINPSTDFNKTHVYDILIEYRPDGSIVVTINGWKVNDIYM